LRNMATARVIPTTIAIESTGRFESSVVKPVSVSTVLTSQDQL
jgi:hypothetical protein